MMRAGSISIIKIKDMPKDLLISCKELSLPESSLPDNFFLRMNKMLYLTINFHSLLKYPKSVKKILSLSRKDFAKNWEGADNFSFVIKSPPIFTLLTPAHLKE